jgi:hypothetical protein
MEQMFDDWQIPFEAAEVKIAAAPRLDWRTAVMELMAS